MVELAGYVGKINCVALYKFDDREVMVYPPFFLEMKCKEGFKQRI